MWYIRSQLGDEPHYIIMNMKKMVYTTKTDRNRRNSESRIVKLCLNVMPSRDGGRRTVNPLSLRDLGATLP